MPALSQFSTSGKRKKNRVQPVNVGGIAAGPVTLETVNRHWEGKQALIRIGAFIYKGRDKRGWSYSKWGKSPELPGERPIEFRVGLSDRKLLLDKGFLYRKKTLRAGTPFVAHGWNLSTPEKGKGLQLNLKIEGLPVDAVIELKKDKLEDLEDAERAMRIQIFQLTGISDEAKPVGVSSDFTPTSSTLPLAGSPQPTAPLVGSAAVQPSAPTSGQPVFSPTVEVLAVSVQPAEAPPGGEVSLVVQYRVDGLPPGFSYEVSETRRILLDGSEAARFDDTVPRGVGSFTSAQSMTVPPDAPSGFYSFEVAIRLAGVEQSGSAFFRVVDR